MYFCNGDTKPLPVSGYIVAPDEWCNAESESVEGFMNNYGIDPFNNAWLTQLAQPISPYPSVYPTVGGVRMPQTAATQNHFAVFNPVASAPSTFNMASFNMPSMGGGGISQSYLQTVKQVNMMMAPVMTDLGSFLTGLLQSAASRPAGASTTSAGGASPSSGSTGALSWAQARVGKNEKDNRDEIIKEYAFGTAVLLDPENGWCASFVTNAFNKAGGGAPWGKKETFVYKIRDWGKANNKFIDKSGTPQPGDVIIFGAKGDQHTGIVEKVENGKVYTVEGNTSNSVGRRSYSLKSNYIYGYVRP